MKSTTCSDHFLTESIHNTECPHHNHHEYICNTCQCHCCECCAIEMHLQHTITGVFNHQSVDRLLRHSTDIEWLIEKQGQVDILGQIIKQYIDEQIMLIELGEQDITLQSDYKDTICKYINQHLIITQDQSMYLDIDQFIKSDTTHYTTIHIKVINKPISQYDWYQVCNKLQGQSQITTLDIDLSQCEFDSSQFEILCKAIVKHGFIQDLRINLSKTNLDSWSTYSINQLITLVSLRILVLDITMTKVSWSAIDCFWSKSKQLIFNSFQRFYVFHHLCIMYVYQIHLLMTYSSVNVIHPQLAMIPYQL